MTRSFNLWRGPAVQAAFVLMVIVIPVALLAWLMHAIMLPIVIASVLYVLLNPAVSLLRQRGINKTVAITVVLALLLGLLVWFVVAMVPLLSEQFASFRERLPLAWENLSRLLTKVEFWLAEVAGVPLDRGGLLQAATGTLRGISGKLVAKVSGLLTNAALWALLIPMISFFFLRDYQSLRNYVLDRVPNRMFEQSLNIYHKVSNQLELYIRSVMLQSLIMATVTGIGFTLIGLPLAILLGILAGVFNLIPYVGPVLALVAPVLVALSMSTDPALVVAAISVIVVGQLVDNLLVVPTLLARAANLHPLVALLAIIVAGNLFGLMGMVFALPVMAASRIIYTGVYRELQPLY